MATMAVDTATIRVTRATRDLLATQAHGKGLSVAAFLAEIARDHELQAIWHSEREAARLDAQNPSVGVEDREWETALTDGLD